MKFHLTIDDLDEWQFKALYKAEENLQLLLNIKAVLKTYFIYEEEKHESWACDPEFQQGRTQAMKAAFDLLESKELWK